jgi:hypothetical protein
MIFHRHKFGEIKDGYQYCEKCGLAKLAPIPLCQHEYKVIERYESFEIYSPKDPLQFYTGPNKPIIVYVSECTKCGDVRKN